MAAQLMATKGWSLRLLSRCRARATIPLPVPLSPLMKTLESVSAARATASKTRFMASLGPMMFCPSRSERVRRRSRFTSRDRRAFSMPLRIWTSSSRLSKGLVR